MMTTEYTMAVEWQCRDIHAWVECDLDKIDPQKNEKKFLYRSKVLPYVTSVVIPSHMTMIFPNSFHI